MLRFTDDIMPLSGQAARLASPPAHGALAGSPGSAASWPPSLFAASDGSPSTCVSPVHHCEIPYSPSLAMAGAALMSCAKRAPDDSVGGSEGFSDDMQTEVTQPPVVRTYAAALAESPGSTSNVLPQTAPSCMPRAGAEHAPPKPVAAQQSHGKEKLGRRARPKQDDKHARRGGKPAVAQRMPQRQGRGQRAQANVLPANPPPQNAPPVAPAPVPLAPPSALWVQGSHVHHLFQDGRLNRLSPHHQKTILDALRRAIPSLSGCTVWRKINTAQRGAVTEFWQGFAGQYKSMKEVASELQQLEGGFACK